MDTHYGVEIPPLLFTFYETLGKMKLHQPISEVAAIYFLVLWKLNKVFQTEFNITAHTE